jgi:hypothetical protein
LVWLFKLGIVNREQLASDHLEGLLNSHKFIALDLYDSLDGLPEAEVDKIQERALSWFRVQNGVLKNSRRTGLTTSTDYHFPPSSTTSLLTKSFVCTTSVRRMGGHRMFSTTS